MFGFLACAAALLALGAPAPATEGPLVLACNDFPPLKIEHPAADGLRGADVEAIEEIARRTGIEITTPFMPWKRAYAEASNGTIGGLCSCSYRADREALFYFSDPIGDISVGFFEAPGAKFGPISSLGQLAGGKLGPVGVVKGYNLEEELEDAKIEHVSVSVDRQAYDMLLNHRFELLYSFRAPIDFLLRQDATRDLQYSELRSSPYFICLSRKAAGSEAALKRINEAIGGMRADGTFAVIDRRYGRTAGN